VRHQVERILASPAFHSSKRYASVLKFIVDQTLEGYGDRLKERTIGIEVFNRRPDYDTGTDHAVRSAVAEVRKRLAQYYLNGAGDELRIEIQPGCYTPQFRRRDGHRLAAIATQIAPLRVGDLAAQPIAASAARRAWLWPLWLIAACAMLAAAVMAVRQQVRARDPLIQFWKPMLKSRAPILVCIGNVEGGRETTAQIPSLSPTLTLSEFHNSPFSTVNVYDAFTSAKFAGLMQANGKSVRFASQSDATFTDLQGGPTILVGLLNNVWTERLEPKLRFTVEQPQPGKFVIHDRNNPSKSDWSVDYSKPYLDLTKDYALVLRMVDPKTEQPVVVAAGIAVFGTWAAGNFLTSENEIKRLTAVAPPGWENKNMEIVLSTEVIRGRSGPATIVAAQFW
jgi:hypothetical protein